MQPTETRAIIEDVGSTEKEKEEITRSENPEAKDDAEPVEKDADDDGEAGGR